MSDSKNTKKRKHFLDESRGNKMSKIKRVEEEEEDWKNWEEQIEEEEFASDEFLK